MVADINRRSTHDRDPRIPSIVSLLTFGGTWLFPTFTARNRYVLARRRLLLTRCPPYIICVLIKHKSDASSSRTEILAAIAFLGHQPRRVYIDNGFYRLPFSVPSSLAFAAELPLPSSARSPTYATRSNKFFFA